MGTSDRHGNSLVMDGLSPTEVHTQLVKVYSAAAFQLSSSERLGF